MPHVSFYDYFNHPIFFLALMEIAINLLAPRHILITLRMDLQITKETHSQLAVQVPQIAISRLKWWTWILWNGAMDLTTHSPQSKFGYSKPITHLWTILFRRIQEYSTASTSEAAYIIGGPFTSDIIAEFKNGNWRQFGTLSKGRSVHGSIQMGNEYMVIGGSSSDKR